MLRRALALVGLVLVLATTSPASRADDANRECDNDRDVTIVVDFNELGGGVNVRCAPQPIKNGFDVFKNANVSYEQYQGFVCRIAGKPSAEDESCNRYPPANAYWVYFYAQRGGQWTYSNYGASARKPPPGSIDGWSFFVKSSDADKPEPPRYPVPPPVASATTTTTAATTATTATGGGGGGPAPAPGAPNTPTPTQLVVDPRTTRADPEPEPDGATTTSLEASDEVAASATSTSVRLGNVDLSVGGGGGGTSFGFLLSAGAVVGLALAGFVFLRLRGA